MDRWLESLLKAHAPVGTAVPAAPNVPLEFVDLVRVDADDVAGASVPKLYLDDPDDSDIPSPVEAFFAKATNARFRIPEMSTSPATHADGVELEKVGGATWTHTYANGSLTKSLVVDSTLPGRQAFFDGRGNEIGRAEYLKIDGTATEAYIETNLAKILGVSPGDQFPEELPLSK
jgi:hypothetical protein